MFAGVADVYLIRPYPDFIGVNEVLEADILPQSMHFSPPLRGSLWLNYLVYAIDQCASFQLGVSSRHADFHDKLFSMAFMLCDLLENGANPHVVFRWWSECTDIGRNDCHNLEPSPRRYLFSSSSNPEASPLQESICTRADGTAVCVDDLSQCNDPGKTDMTKAMRLGADFGLEVTVGTLSIRQLIQGPQWPSMRDTQLMRFFLLAFGSATGTVTLRDVFKAMCSIHDLVPCDSEEKREFIAYRDKLLQSIDNSLGQETAQDAHSESYERSAPLDQPKQTLPFTFGKIWREYKILVLSLLGKWSFQGAP